MLYIYIYSNKDLPIPKELMEPKDKVLLIIFKPPSLYAWTEIVQPPKPTALPTSIQTFKTIAHSLYI